jgi:hypothetical protein
MAKGQQKTNKEVKKPKKSTEPMKVGMSSEPVRTQMTTTVFPKGKEKNK